MATRKSVTIQCESGHTYAGYGMGTGQHGSEDVGFTWDVLVAMVEAGDGADSNGEGLHLHGWPGYATHTACDVAEGEHVDVPMVDGLYVPQGRAWEIVEDVACLDCGTPLPLSPGWGQRQRCAEHLAAYRASHHTWQ